MLKTFKTIQAQDREKFVAPESVQDVIPVKRIWDDGIFLVGKNKYSKMFRFDDVNYSSASDEEKAMMTAQYAKILNSFDVGATSKITINNRRMNMDDFTGRILLDMCRKTAILPPATISSFTDTTSRAAKCSVHSTNSRPRAFMRSTKSFSSTR